MAVDDSTGAQPRPLRVLGISGSLRAGSFNTALLRAARDMTPAGMELSEYTGLGEIPPYNADVDARGKPEVILALNAAIRDADAVLIATPEYNYSIPGALKNAIDWVSRPVAETPLRGKPTALMGATGGMSGTMRAQLHLRQCFVYLGTPSVLQPEVLCSFAAQKIDEFGHLHDQVTRDLIAKLLSALAELVARYA